MEPQDANVSTAIAALHAALDDKDRVAAAYCLAFAKDCEAATTALVEALAGDDASDMLRRAAKHGAAAACRQQLFQAVGNDATDPPIVRLLLQVVASSNNALAVACAARALMEHGAWCLAAPSIRLRVVEVLAQVAIDGVMVPSIPLTRGVEDHGMRPPGAGSRRGIISKWVKQRNFGFIKPAEGGEETWVGIDAFGGGVLVEGGAVWYDIEVDPRLRRPQAVRVAGPAVWRAGASAVGTRNARAAALESLATVPQEMSEPAAERVAEVLTKTLSRFGTCADKELVGNAQRLPDGEALMAAAFGVVRFTAQMSLANSLAGHSSAPSLVETGWWPRLRQALLAVVDAAAAARPPAGARPPGAGGTPGADQGLRYTLAHCLQALLQAGDTGALEVAVQRLPPESRGPPREADSSRKLLLRRCHLTTAAHSF